LGIAPILKIDRQHVGDFDFLNVPFFAPWPVFAGDVLSESRFRSCNFARSASCGDMASSVEDEPGRSGDEFSTG